MAYGRMDDDEGWLSEVEGVASVAITFGVEAPTSMEDDPEATVCSLLVVDLEPAPAGERRRGDGGDNTRSGSYA